MRADSRSRPPGSLVFLVGGLSLVAAAGVALPPQTITKPSMALLLVVVIVAAREWLLRWRNLVLLILLVVLLIPMRRYTLPASLPFQLEPYRVIVAFVAVGWLASLFIDHRVQLKRTGLEGPLACYGLIAFVSMAVNPGRVAGVESTLVKTLMFWVSYVVIIYLLPSVLRGLRDVDLVCRVLVAGGAFVAFTAIIESRTHFNVFNHLSTVMPFLHLGALPLTTSDFSAVSRGWRLRAYASAQHPIALGAAFMVILPLALYLAKKTGQRRWSGAAALLLVGLFATGSKTAVLMLVGGVLVLLRLRTREVKKYWPALIPAIVLVHFAVPGTLGAMWESFFPKGGLVAQSADNNVGSGRIATLGPVLHSEFYPHPIVGEGFGTRLAGDNGPVMSNAPILDDQWLGVLCETGILGALAFLWLLVRATRMLARASRARPGPDGWLPAALAASIVSYAVGMLTFDAFSFIQVTFLFVVMLGLTGTLYANGELSPPASATQAGDGGRG